MRRQLQYTTVVVFVLLLGLISTMYLLNNYILPSGSSQITAATVSVPIENCSKPLPSDASSSQKQRYEEQCNSSDK